MEQKNPKLIRKYTGIMYFIIGVAFAVALFFEIKALSDENFTNQIISISAVGILIISIILLYVGKIFLGGVNFKNKKHKAVFLSIGSFAILCFFNGIISGGINAGISFLNPWKIILLHIQMGSILMGTILLYTLLWINIASKK